MIVPPDEMLFQSQPRTRCAKTVKCFYKSGQAKSKAEGAANGCLAEDRANI